MKKNFRLDLSFVRWSSSDDLQKEIVNPVMHLSPFGVEASLSTNRCPHFDQFALNQPKHFGVSEPRTYCLAIQEACPVGNFASD
jgi:hypothetical protein